MKPEYRCTRCRKEGRVSKQMRVVQIYMIEPRAKKSTLRYHLYLCPKCRISILYWLHIGRKFIKKEKAL